MDRVGGYAAYRELLADARAYEDVVLVMEAESEANQILALKRAAEGKEGRRG